MGSAQLESKGTVTFEIDDMTCGHCVSTITNAVRSVDKGVKVQVALAPRRVQVESTEADAQGFSDAIKKAGYTPVPVEARVAQATASARSGGCYCGFESGCRS
jgi:copper chaperone